MRAEALLDAAAAQEIRLVGEFSASTCGGGSEGVGGGCGDDGTAVAIESCGRRREREVEHKSRDKFRSSETNEDSERALPVESTDVSSRGSTEAKTELASTRKRGNKGCTYE